MIKLYIYFITLIVTSVIIVGCTTTALYNEVITPYKDNPDEYTLKVFFGGSGDEKVIRQRAEEEVKKFMVTKPEYKNYTISVLSSNTFATPQLVLMGITEPTHYVYRIQFYR